MKMTGTFYQPTCFSKAEIDLEGGARLILETYPKCLEDGDKVMVSFVNGNWDVEKFWEGPSGQQIIDLNTSPKEADNEQS